VKELGVSGWRGVPLLERGCYHFFTFFDEGRGLKLRGEGFSFSFA